MNYEDTTDEEFMTVLRQVVSEQPEHKDGSCKYVHGDACGCLIGHALHRLGVPLKLLDAWEGYKASDVVSGLMPGISLEFRIDLDGIQNLQDDRRSWRAALDG